MPSKRLHQRHCPATKVVLCTRAAQTKQEALAQKESRQLRFWQGTAGAVWRGRAPYGGRYCFSQIHRGAAPRRTATDGPMKQRLLCCCLWVVLMAANSPPINAEDLTREASTLGITPEALALEKVLNARVRDSDATNDPKWRASLADALHRYCESILVQVPRNTPQEDQWVESELHDLSLSTTKATSERFNQEAERWSERMKRVENSAEYARQGMRHGLSECSSITDSLMEPKQPSAAEALRWVRLSRMFSIEDEAWRLAKIIGLVSDCGQMNSATARPDFLLKGLPPGSHDKNHICLTWGSVHHSIIDQAVIPLLEAQ